MNRKQRRAAKPIQKSASDYAHAGNIAHKKGDHLQALECYAQAVSIDPDHHQNKLRLAYLLKDAKFPTPNPKMKALILNCLETDGLDHQNLFKPWLSLLLCDPNFRALQNIMRGEDFSPNKLKSNIQDRFFLAGLGRMNMCDMALENALHTIYYDVVEGEEKFKPFLQAFEAYGEHSEYVAFRAPPKQKKYKIDSTIVSLSAPESKISKSVAAQYEDNPYPRWTGINVQAAANTSEKPYDHLVAGCGTGYGTCATAMLHPNARIIGVDITLASLSYAKAKAQELGLNNVEFFQADILSLEPLEKTFDVIECSGVLHHMLDPLEGWRSLLTKLKSDGKMSIGLYSELGRADVVAAREFIEQEGFDSTHDSIREARQKIYELPADHPAREVINRRDFYTMSNCRDLVFHVQEHRFTISRLQDSLDQLGLKFDGFDIHNAPLLQQYSLQFPDDPQRLNLDNWAVFEEHNPTSFRSMYQLWCSRK